jgi:hypothetical protein
MNASARNELASIKRELNSIISELESISKGVRNDFTGIGNNKCALPSLERISNMTPVPEPIANIKYIVNIRGRIILDLPFFLPLTFITFIPSVILAFINDISFFGEVIIL